MCETERVSVSVSESVGVCVAGMWRATVAVCVFISQIVCLFVCIFACFIDRYLHSLPLSYYQIFTSRLTHSPPLAIK